MSRATGFILWTIQFKIALAPSGMISGKPLRMVVSFFGGTASNGQAELKIVLYEGINFILNRTIEEQGPQH